jgi:radical SAM protein with 4Fe4S-binding SPASM domain
MTLSRLNIDSIEETVKIAEADGFSGIGFSRLVPCGSGESLLDILLTAQEIKTAYERALAVTITSDGSVMPCRRIGLKIGNLRKTSLRQIWSTSKVLWRLRQRESYKGECGKCSLWPSCRGCRAVAYAYSKSRGAPDLFADDPQCWMVHLE